MLRSTQPAVCSSQLTSEPAKLQTRARQAVAQGQADCICSQHVCGGLFVCRDIGVQVQQEAEMQHKELHANCSLQTALKVCPVQHSYMGAPNQPAASHDIKYGWAQHVELHPLP